MIVLEDVHIAGMLKNHRLARAIADVDSATNEYMSVTEPFRRVFPIVAMGRGESVLEFLEQPDIVNIRALYI